MSDVKNWKLKLRYGKLKTSFQHFTVIADGETFEQNDDFGTIAGSPAFFRINAWAIDDDQAVDMVISIGRHLGFDATGRIYIYSTDPTEPPGDEPHAYGLGFNSYQHE
ncbi:hypothetical protein [Neorhizobium alkalisoli]|uniref:Uncharacterized protein n=1 Tax=Neorhizobium alkalisoli TaxID=528178 RepID=A0A561QV04_9HYPH|nr:hypothetical protein [Neorhizobium alkalisoli]TWF54192.1 hypothetical protein FHW37_10353 [Neorhizobium alkalisoli]